MPMKAILESKRVNISQYPHDTCGVSRAFMEECGFHAAEPVCARNAETGETCHLRIAVIEGVADGAVRLSKRLCTALGAQAGSTIELASDALLNYAKVALQLANASGTAKVQIPQADYDALDRSHEFYRLICAGSGSELVVRVGDIEPYETAEGQEHTIKLDRYQRKLLRLEMPLECTEALAASFLAQAAPEERAFVESCYEGDVLRDDVSYGDRQRAYKILCNGGYAHIYLAPLFQKASAAASGGAFQGICDFYLKANTMTLRCVRPYDLDEGKQIVRLSSDTMALLGIEEGDVVCLGYGRNVQRARALAMESEGEMRQTNLLEEGASYDNLVGIPAALRANLGMNTIDTTVEVKRDTKSLFKKHLNIQLVSLLAWLFTILQTVEVFDVNPWVATAVFIVMTPLILYAILSEERSRVRPIDG